jgi:hypothetical protein
MVLWLQTSSDGNDCGGLLGVCFAAGNVDDRHRTVIHALTKPLQGKIVGDNCDLLLL